MATTISVVLRKKQKKDGTYPLAIRYTRNGKSSFTHLGKSINLKDWDDDKKCVKRSHLNSVRFNNYISKKLLDAQQAQLELETEGNPDTVFQLKRKIEKGNEKVTFFTLAMEKYELNLKAKKYDRAYAIQGRIKAFKNFLGGQDIYLEDITPELLEEYAVYAKNMLGNNQWTIYSKISFIHTIYNRAIERGYARYENSPFGKNKYQLKRGNAKKIGLSREELILLRDAPLKPGSYLCLARDIFMFSFYFAGIRIADVLHMKWSNVQGERLVYRMRKNGKLVSLAIPPQIHDLLLYYKEIRKPKDEYIFHFLNEIDLSDSHAVYRRGKSAAQYINSRLQVIAEQLGIHSKITNHIARHTFGNLAKGNINPQQLQKLYKHSNLATTVQYQNNFIHDQTDAAHLQVISI